VVETKFVLSERETEILDALIKLRKEIISGVMFVYLSVRPSVRLSVWSIAAPTGQMFYEI